MGKLFSRNKTRDPPNAYGLPNFETFEGGYLPPSGYYPRGGYGSPYSGPFAATLNPYEEYGYPGSYTMDSYLGGSYGSPHRLGQGK